MISAIAIPSLISVNKTADEAAAKSNLRSLSSAVETASVSLRYYPVTVAELQGFISMAPDYCADVAGTQSAVQGYNYSCTMDLTGYTLVASPTTPGTTGNVTYTGSTGGILTPL